MLTTNQGRTNLVPASLAILCLVLFCARAALVMYTTCYPSPTIKIAWQKTEPIDLKSHHVLGKPRFYFFSDSRTQFSKICCDVFESALFNNRELVHKIQSEFSPMKVVRDNQENTLALALCDKFDVSVFPSIVITLPNGQYVETTTWQSDRMLMAHLSDQKEMCLNAAAYAAMRNQDFPTACEAFSQYVDKGPDDVRARKMWDYLFFAVALLHEKRKVEAQEVLQKGLLAFNQRYPKQWPGPCFQYLMNTIDQGELMKKAKEGGGDVAGFTAAHYFIAEHELLGGNKAAAASEFVLAANGDSKSYCQNEFARAEMKAMGVKVDTKDSNDNAKE